MPSKQEEIREGIKEWVLEIRQYLCSTEFAPEPFKEPVETDVLTIEFPKKLLSYLAKEGCVLKVERELPSVFNGKGEVMSALEYRKKLAGYGTFEPLIEQ